MCSWEKELISIGRGVGLLYHDSKYQRKKMYCNGNFFYLCFENNTGYTGNVTLNDKNEIVTEKILHSNDFRPNLGEHIILKKLEEVI